VDNLPVRGRVRSKVWLGFKIAVINFKRLIRSRINGIKDALAVEGINYLSEIFSFQRSAAAILAA
jgi:hypothetical protein